MAKNVYSLQLLRNTQIFADKETAISGITSAATQDGVIKLARYTEGDETKTIFGIYHDFGEGDSGYTIYDSYQEVIDAIQEKIADLESGSTEIMDILGDGVSTANTVTDQLEALSGDSASTSADTSVEGAKRYADEKVADAVADLDGTITADTGYYINKVDEVDGKISGTTAALPTVAAISSEGQAITAVSQSLGTVDASYGDIAAAHVTVADANSAFTATTVEDVLAEIDAAYKAADAAIIGGASASGDTLGKLEDRIEALDADAKEYSIVKTTTGLPETIKERYELKDADGNVSGDTIDIPKDSHIVSITYDGTTQKLTYNYIDVSGNTQSTDVDMSELVLETEFASGVTFSNGVAHGVVDPTSETFLTVGADGFKLSGVQDAIDSAYEGLDATVTGETSGSHISITIEEVDGKLVQSGLTIAEENIADADDLAELSAKTVTEIASSNSSITVDTAATTAADGTVKYDIVTDASKIKMSGFTAATSGFTAITEDSSVEEAVEAIESEYIAINTELDKKIENIVVNSVSGSVDANHIASVTIDGSDVALSADYEKATADTAVSSGDTIDEAIGKLEKQIENAVAGGLQEVEAGSGITVSAVASNKQTITAKLTAAADLPNNIAENAIKFDSTNNGMYIEYIDAGTY